MKIKLSKIYKFFEAEYNNGYDNIVTGVSIDSRTIKKGDLFFAIKGDNFDGHDFINNAMNSEAAAIVCSKKDKYINDKVIYVEDTLKALKDLAKYYRLTLDIPFIAVTGSNGKTTTKEYINAALSASLKTSYTKGNLNNQTGVPLTIFSINEDSNAAVIEMGMNNPGEIKELSSIVIPDIAVITNIGTSHIGRLGSRDNIFRAKKEVLEFLNNGYLVINADDDMLCNIKSNNKYKVIRTGINADSLDYAAKDIVFNNDNTYSFSVKNSRIKLSIPGIHNVNNALLAIAVADLLKVDLDKAAVGISACINQKMRTQITKMNGYVIINDAYNANYDSMKASIDILKRYENRKVAILGDMLELGDYEKEMHQKTGEYLAKNGIDVLIAVGKNSVNYRNGALNFGMNESNIFVFDDLPHAKVSIKDIICKGDTILLKGSRGSSMEKIMEIFEGENL
ncbi:MAG: UDP-N-acetylmuramoyl-tripeptide--D-alanyl-D-alanine ligase [Clostridia bacterium]|jgi:UDP-N-acetylmuramoyl-tripeptide--D-alanyl-D-alanine ligase